MDSEHLKLLKTATDPRWVGVALADLDAVHSDHLHCERKAAQSALSLVRSYPARADVVAAATRLAHEETSHVIQVEQIVAGRGGLRYDTGDEYARGLRALIRKDEPGRQFDTLAVFALIEARSAERLGLLAEALPDAEVARLYKSLASAELRHRDIFVELALATPGADDISLRARLRELADAEAELIARLPIRARIH
jgi:tRNA-(ms[2]io[6]A)-hydroxylase